MHRFAGCSIGAAALLLALAGAGTASAQSMRSFTTARQHHGETRLAARLEYAAGVLRVGPGDGNLYHMRLVYDQDRFAPASRYDGPAGAVTLGLRSIGDAGIRVSSRQQLEQTATVELSPDVDLALDVALGATEAELDVGGLRLTSLKLTTAGSRAVVDFSKPNPVRCRSAEFSAGAAEVTITGLGNSRCGEIRFEAGVGRAVLDFSGAESDRSRADIRMAMGELVLRLPRGTGVRLTMDRFLSSFQPAGLIRQGTSYVTEGYDRAARTLDIELRATIGGVTVEWVD